MKAFLCACAAAVLLSPTAAWTQVSDAPAPDGSAKGGSAKQPKEKDYRLEETSGWISETLQHVDGRRDSAIFQEYQNFPDLGTDLHLEHRPDKDHYYEFIGRHIGLDDQYERFTAQDFGQWKFRATYDEIPHRYSFNSTTIYSGDGTGNLTIDPTLRKALQGIATESVSTAKGSRAAFLIGNGLGGGAFSASQATSTIRLQDLAAALNTPGLAGEHTIDVGTERERLALQLDIAAWNPAYLSVTFKNENKTGTKPTLWTFGSSPGTPDVVEVAEPINYNTKQYKVNGDYIQKNYSASLNYYHSDFKNNTPTVAFDNPFLTKDGLSVTSNGSASSSITGSAARGLAILPPSNSFDQFTLQGVVKDLFWKGRLTGQASWGERRQDDALFPFTDNSSLTGAAIGQPFAANDPRLLGSNLSANDKVDTLSLDFNWNARPTKDLRLKARWREYDYDNVSANHLFVGRVEGDAAFTAAPATLPFSPVNSSWDKKTTTLSASYDINKQNNLTVEYVNDIMSRDVREVAHSNEDTWTVSEVSHLQNWLDIRSSASTGRRRGVYDPLRGGGLENFQTGSPQDLAFHLNNANATFTANSPILQKFDMGDRDRSRAQAQAIIYPNDQLTVTTFIQYGHDEYGGDAQIMGLNDTQQNVIGLDVDWVGKRVTVSGSVSRERLRRDQDSRTWQNSATFASVGAAATNIANLGNYYLTNPPLTFFDLSNWSSTEETTTDTISANVNYVLDPKTRKQGVDLGVLYARSDGNIDFLSPQGTPTQDKNPWIPLSWPNVDDSKHSSVSIKYHNNLSDHWTLSAGYLYDHLSFSDFEKDGLQLAPTTGNNPIVPATGQTPAPLTATAAGQFTGILNMNTLVQPYNVNAVYTTITYKF